MKVANENNRLTGKGWLLLILAMLSAWPAAIWVADSIIERIVP
jgi:hypothetical protein